MNMRHIRILAWMLIGFAISAPAQVSIDLALPGVSIGVDVPAFPELERVPGYPVYYAPGLSSNYFFYDGMYWVYQRDNWYASTWYNGPWGLVSPESVPLFVLRVPVRYYRDAPIYFRGWRDDAPPRWGDHWGDAWQQQRRGWDRWDHSRAPGPAPLPTYQRQYSAERYPRQTGQQQELQRQNYRYQPHDPVVRQHFQASAPAQAPRERSADVGAPAPRAQMPAVPGHEQPLPARVNPAMREQLPQPGVRLPQAPGERGVQPGVRPPEATSERVPPPGLRQPQAPGERVPQAAVRQPEAPRDRVPQAAARQPEAPRERAPQAAARQPEAPRESAQRAPEPRQGQNKERENEDDRGQERRK